MFLKYNPICEFFQLRTRLISFDYVRDRVDVTYRVWYIFILHTHLTDMYVCYILKII